MAKSHNIEIAKSIESCISNTSDRHSKWLSENPKYQSISHSLSKLCNRSREYKNPSFVVLVVGPVKAGKSTFVNLVANSYVSPTHFLECTIRPSIVHAGSKESITVYHSSDKANDADQMDDILDCVNGLIEKESVSGVDTNEVELNEQNINKYVKGGVNSDDDIILTSISTKGGKLIQNNVFLVDMPGFDGNKANFDKVYETIVKRADLIIFVQSSNSAISKVSSDFFDFIKAHNNSAPVCLIHNIFEAAFWRSDASKMEDIEDQKQYAIQAIQQKGLSISEENSFNLNLGMVSDKRNHKYESQKERLETEDEHLAETEGKMHELFKKRENIRVCNCITRTRIQRDELISLIEKAIEEIEDKIGRYNKIVETFDHLKINHWPEGVTDENGNNASAAEEEEIDEKSAIDSAYLTNQILNDVYSKYTHHIVTRRYSCKYLRSLAKQFLGSVESELNEHLNSKISELKQLKNLSSIKSLISAINGTVAQLGIMEFAEVQSEIPEYKIEFAPEINIESVIPFKLWYNEEEVYLKLDHIYKDLYGKFLKETKQTFIGYIPKEVFNDMKNKVAKAKKELKAQIITSINAEIERLKTLAIESTSTDIEKLKSEAGHLRNLRTDLSNINIQIYE